MTERAEILAAYAAHEAIERAGSPFLLPEMVEAAIRAVATELEIPASDVADTLRAQWSMAGS